MHLLLPILVLCSAIFRRVFLALYSPRSLREPLLQLRCHHLALATQLALAQKSTFLKIPISFTSLIPSPILPKDEREMTERTTTQLPANKKCCLLIFAIAIGCLVLAAIPAPPPAFLCPLSRILFGFSFLPAASLVLGDFPPSISRLDTLHSTLHTSALLLASTPAEGAQPAHRALHLA